MSIKLTAESFLNVVKQSGLLEKDQLKRLVQEFHDRGVDVKSSRAIADELVAMGAVTRWQVEKLLQGKHKGFMLGRYRLLDLLGKGGMSSVYLAEQTLLRRRCAIKVLPTKRVDDSSYLARFYREAQAVAALDHPNIVRAYDVGQEVDKDAQIHFLVMEYVDGQSMQGLVQNRGPLGFGETAEYFRQAALGLHHAHQAGLVHRDVKPGNLLVDSKGVVKVLDLGLARFFAEDDENSLTVAHDEKVLGTADYLAPEQALDSHTVDIRADIYSLGCAMYFVLTGHPPFNEGTLAQRLMCHQTKEPPPITQDRPDAPSSLLAIISKLMRKQREDRYQTAQEVADVLASWLAQSAAPQPEQPPTVATVVMPAVPVLEPPTAITLSASAATRFVTAPAEPEASDSWEPPFAAPVGVPIESSGAWPTETSAPSETDDTGLVNFLSGLQETVTVVPRTTSPVAPPLVAPPVPAKPATSAAPPVVATPVFAQALPPSPPPAPAAPRIAAEPLPAEPFTAEPFGAVPSAEAGWDESALPWLTPAAPPPAAIPLPAAAPREARPIVAAPVLAVPVAVAAPLAPASVPMAVPVAAKSDSSSFRAPPPVAAVVLQPATSLPTAPEPPWAFDAGEDEPIAEDGFDFLSPASPAAAAPVVAPAWQPTAPAYSAVDATLPVPNFAAASVAEAESQPPWSVPSTPSVSSTTVAKKTRSRRPMIIVNAVIGVILVLVAASVAIKTFSGSGAKDTSVPVSGNGTHAGPRTVAADLRVGPGAQFSTLGEALADVKKRRDEYKDRSPDTPLVIGIAGGQNYAERIDLDNSKNEYPKGLAIIAEGAQNAVLSSREQGPIVKLTGIDGLKLEGLTFFGSIGTNGVELSGPGSNSHVTLSRCRFSDPSSPLDVAIVIRSKTSSVSILDSIFDQARFGIHVDGKQLEHTDLLVGNNTFCGVTRSILFSDMPAASSHGLAFQRNLFAGCKTIELIVENGYNAANFQVMLEPQGLGTELNWSDHSLTPLAPGEFDLIASSQQRVDALRFVMDRNSPKFLTPKPNSPYQNLARSNHGLKPYAGAVAP